MGASLLQRAAILQPPSFRRSPFSAPSPVRFCGCLSLRVWRWLLLAEAPRTLYGQLLLVAPLLRLPARLLTDTWGRGMGPAQLCCAVPCLRSASPEPTSRHRHWPVRSIRRRLGRISNWSGAPCL